MIKVVLAFLYDNNGRVLLAQRPEGKSYGGLWEFPGGKIESNESPEEATVRELREELAAVVTPLRVHPAYEFLNDKGLIIEFFPVTCDWETHPLTLHEHQRVEFVEVREVPSWDLAPPDYNALKYLEHIP